MAVLFLLITGYKLLFDDWRGYVIAGFSLVWVANFYMSVFGRVRLGIRRERIEIETGEKALKDQPTEERRARRNAIGKVGGGRND